LTIASLVSNNANRIRTHFLQLQLNEYSVHMNKYDFHTVVHYQTEDKSLDAV
jgi:hypothetical protein